MRSPLEKPVETLRMNAASVNIATNAWATLAAAVGFTCTSMEIFNATGSILRLAIGSAGNEVEQPYTILPGGSSIVVPLEVARGLRISVRALDLATSVGYVILNLFG